MTRGLVIGKFYPPHRGHKFLIDFALKNVDRLDVLVCVRSDQSISGRLRQQWLQEIHPVVNVQEIEDPGKDDDSEFWAKFTVQILGYVPDIVFTSEDYGEAYARSMGCRHVMVDREREHFAISGRMVRSAPLRHWDYLEPCVRAHFAKRVCLVGAESTGTTTLARELAEHYKTVWVPEYGREYCEQMQASGVDLWTYQWRSEEFMQIAQKQVELEDRLVREANRILICDTDVVATSIWHERYLGTRSAGVDKIAAFRHYDLYLLTDSDIAFVQDGLRDGESIRQWMTHRFEERLAERNIPWFKLSGGRDHRLRRAIREIDKLLVEDCPELD